MFSRFTMHRLLFGTLVALLLPQVSITSAAEGLERLRYNHPGLAVDLGVGLWAWPVPESLWREKK